MDCYCLKAVKTLSNPRRKENPWAAQRWVAPRYALHALLTSKLLQFQSRQCLWGHCLPPVAPACQPSFCDSPWPNVQICHNRRKYLRPTCRKNHLLMSSWHCRHSPCHCCSCLCLYLTLCPCFCLSEKRASLFPCLYHCCSCLSACLCL